MRRSVTTGGLAAAGVVATHLLTFLVVAPDAHERAHLLHRTGHVRFAFVAAAVLGLVVAAFVRFVRVTRPVAQLVAVQSVGWLALEAVERLVHQGADWEPGVIALGLVVQAVLAVAGALLWFAVRRVLARATGARRLVAPAVASLRLPTGGRTFTRPALLAGAGGLRGPPLHS